MSDQKAKSQMGISSFGKRLSIGIILSASAISLGEADTTDHFSATALPQGYMETTQSSENVPNEVEKGNDETGTEAVNQATKPTPAAKKPSRGKCGSGRCG